MTEIIINYPSKPVLVQLATALGYYDQQSKTITAQGSIVSGGSYFFNDVGPVPGQSGLWARLRHNGDQAVLDGHMSPQIMAQAAALGVTIYKRATINGQSVWTADGTTAGPAYLDTIGVIA